MQDLRIREAITSDIPDIMKVRLAVKENRLSDPGIVTSDDCEEYINNRGKGWVALYKKMVVGFAIVDLKEENVWALFLHPEFECRGIGKRLHRIMLNWYFGQGKTKVWLSTDPSSRANEFYQRQGWMPTQMLKNGEQKFDMSFEIWNQKSSTQT